MERLIINHLIEWKDSPKRKPLILQGARQIGKTFIVNQFGKSAYKNYIKINFEEDENLKEIFTTLDPHKIISQLSLYLNKPILAKDTLLFFDEIQAFSQAITSLKYFQENAPAYHIIAAGSLLGVSVGKTTGFPVGKVNFLTMYPMSFQEYLMAKNEKLMIDELLNIQDFAALPEILHEKMLAELKLYLFLGGMPEAVQQYIENQDIVAVRKIQNEILQSYQKDFSKYAEPKEAIKIAELWRSIPYQLAKENNKFMFSEVKSKARAVHFEQTIDWLKNAGLVHIVNELRAAKLPLGGYADLSKFKLYLLDTGLLGAMLNLTPDTIILPDKLFKEYNGAFIENYTCNELIKLLETDVYYWTSGREAEVDFVFQYKNDIIPMEVKSGTNKNTQSLRVYESKNACKYLMRTSPRNLVKVDNFINIPLYRLFGLGRVLDNVFIL
jgi:uncharacterized protein